MAKLKVGTKVRAKDMTPYVITDAGWEGTVCDMEEAIDEASPMDDIAVMGEVEHPLTGETRMLAFNVQSKFFEEV